jgi:hypothetical protein
MRDYIPEQFKNHDQSIHEIESLIKLVNNNVSIRRTTGIKFPDAELSCHV